MSLWKFVTVFFTVSLSLLALTFFLSGFIGLPSIVVWLVFILVCVLFFWKKRGFIKAGRGDLFAVGFAVLSIFILNSFLYQQNISADSDLSLYFFNAHDSFWHVAIMESLSKGIPPENPIFAGENLVGYHYLNDIVWFEIHQLTGISILDIYFWVSPVVLSVLFALSSLLIFEALFANKTVARLGASMLVFGSGLAFFAPFIFPQAAESQSVFWLDQSVHYGVNHQLLFSLAMLNVVFYLAFKHKKKMWWLAGLLAGAMAGIKLYGAVVLLLALGLVALVKNIIIVARRNTTKGVGLDWHLIGTTIVGGFVALLIVLLVGSKDGVPFFWSPGWFLVQQFTTGDHLNHDVWELQRQVFSLDKNYLRLIVHWGYALVVFLFGNFSVKILGLVSLFFLFVKRKIFYLKSSKSNSREKLDILRLSMFLAVLSLIIPLLVIQDGVVWNSIQFMHYAQLPLVILLVWGITQVFKTSKTQALVLLGLFVLMLPTTFQATIKNAQPEEYLTYPQSLVSDITALRTNKQLEGKTLVIDGEIKKLSIIPALSGRNVYWADHTILSILGLGESARENEVNAVLAGDEECPGDWLVLRVIEERLVVEGCE